MAEDNSEVLRLIVNLLQGKGYRVLTANDGEEALAKFAAHGSEVDLLILDVIMPRLGGRGVYEKIHPDHPELPVLFSSGYSEDHIDEDFVTSEDIQFISKPYRPHDLYRAVRETLDRASPTGGTKASQQTGSAFAGPGST